AGIARDIQAVLGQGRVREWMEVFEAAGVPASPINNLAEALEEPQVRALDMVVDVPERDGMQALALPISFDGRRPAIRAPAPGLGADNPIMELDDPWSGA
ncbi:MAG: CoA transferase, partial [Alphaproteobacteria bacterium]|nr:CoA transferase [Alphaproteobacteria bacterium]